MSVWINFKNSFKNLTNTRSLVFGALFIALNVILTRFLSFENQFVRFSLGFLPVALYSMMFGAIPGAFAAAIGDLVGVFLFSKGAFFPGFTLSAFISGILYGLFLYKRKVTVLNVTLVTLIITLLIDLYLNTVWLTMLTGKAAAAFLGLRIVKIAIMFPIQVFLIYEMDKQVLQKLKIKV
ncbi:MAG: folate family ECF transporter S component [Bacillota bacterium]|nr:folate family ECF transporter S component [Bacillota bacterium]